MDVLDQTRSDLEGTEFDWLLVDADGCLALCETAGFGEIPDGLLSRGTTALLNEYRESLCRLLLTLPENGSCTEENHGVGTDEETLAYGRRGLDVFDWVHWSGPYRRIVVPDCPVRVDDAGSLVQQLVASIPQVPIRFAIEQEFQLQELMPCRRCRTG